MKIKTIEPQQEEKAEGIDFEGIETFVKENMTISDDGDSNILYQYTNIEALFNGIIVKKDAEKGKEICLWASNCEYMNDPMELKAGNEFLKQLIGDNFSMEGSFSECYSISFSTTQDSLPMWNMYGLNGFGVALGFDKSILMAEFKDQLYNCLYLDECAKGKIKELMRDYEPVNNPNFKEDFAGAALLLLIALAVAKDKDGKIIKAIAKTLMPAQLLFCYGKSPAYKYENEVRFIEYSKPDTRDVKYRFKNNLIIPYIEKYLPREALKEIWVGPTNDMIRTEKSIKAYLTHMGFDVNHIDIIPSKVPFRG